MKTPRQPFALVVMIFVLLASLGLSTFQAQSSTQVGFSAGEALAEAKTVYVWAAPPSPVAVRVAAPLRPNAVKTAVINVNYTGSWTPQAQAAFEYAVSIWEGLVTSSVPIVVNAEFSASLPPGALGGAGPEDFFRDFTGAPVANTWYPIALANKLAGSDLNGATAEIDSVFSSTFDWYYGTDGNTPGNQYDFASVVLHELGHGLGFVGSMRVVSGSGSWGSGTAYPFIYDRFAENGSNQALLNTGLFPNPSTALASQLTSGNIYFDGPNASAANGSSPVKLYAPGSWQQGSSYSHLDEIFNGTPNELMTYSIGSGDAIHAPGAVTLGMFADWGWSTTSPGPTATTTATVTRTATPTRTVTPIASPYSLNYLPSSLRAAGHFTPTPQPGMEGIYGQVTLSGAPISGVSVELRFYNGSSYASGGFDSTDANGRFQFTGQPSLAGGQSYYVRYSNQSNPSRVFFWGTLELTSYTGGASVNIGNFDIATNDLISPPDGAERSLPVTFQWSTRTDTPSDSYRLHLTDDLYNWFYGPLGFTGSYVLSSLAGGLDYDTYYFWDVYIYAPDGSYGICWDYHTIVFTSSLNGQAEQAERDFAQRLDAIERQRQAH